VLKPSDGQGFAPDPAGKVYSSPYRWTP